VPNRAEAKRRKAHGSGVSRLLAAKPDIRRRAVGNGDGVGMKFCVLTRGDLSVSTAATRVVIVEDERTRR
jgi:hypothetical protein